MNMKELIQTILLITMFIIFCALSCFICHFDKQLLKASNQAISRDHNFFKD